MPTPVSRLYCDRQPRTMTGTVKRACITHKRAVGAAQMHPI